jgi:ATP phosphoribosyltransferase regulatory subunit
MTADRFAALRALFADAGYTFLEPAIVHDASLFVEVAGEDLRRRMFLTSDADGRELALRPEYTVPVCIHHLATGAPTRRASYAYLGPVFRQRSNGPSEFMQAGVESLGRTDDVAADADVLALAFAAAAELKIADAQVTIGDSALFAAVLATLDLPEAWQRRLRRAFGEPERLKGLIAKNAANPRRRTAAPNAAALRAQVAEMFTATGLGVIGARTADEIAERTIEKDALASGIGSAAAQRIAEFLAIAGSPSAAIKALRSLAKTGGSGMGPAIDRFAARSDAFAERGIDVDRLAFAADFGRRLDYYTGFVFEFHRGKSCTPGAVIGGGRYDRLMSLIHHPRAPKRDVPAVGFAISLDRVEAP